MSFESGFAGAGWGPKYDYTGDELKQNQRQFDARLGLYNQQRADWQQQTGGLNNLLAQYNQAYNAAKAQNESKYNQQLGLVDQVSDQQRADTISGFQKQRSDSMQNLARLGMANTTIAPTLQQGIQREQSGALNRLADQMLGTKLGVMQNFNYQGPDSGIYQTAMQTLAPKYPVINF